MKLLLLPRSCDATIFVGTESDRIYTSCFFKAQTRVLDLSGARTEVHCPDLIANCYGTADNFFYGGRLTMHAVKPHPTNPQRVMGAPYCIGNVNRESGYICWGERNRPPLSIARAINQFFVAPFNNHWIPDFAEAYNAYSNLEGLFLSPAAPLRVNGLNASFESIKQIMDLASDDHKTIAIEIEAFEKKSPETKQEVERFHHLFMVYTSMYSLLSKLEGYIPNPSCRVLVSFSSNIYMRLYDLHRKIRGGSLYTAATALQLIKEFGCLCWDCAAETKKLEDKIRAMEVGGLDSKVLAQMLAARDSLYSELSRTAYDIESKANQALALYEKWIPTYRPSASRYSDMTDVLVGTDKLGRVYIPGGTAAVFYVRLGERASLPEDVAKKYPCINSITGSPIPVEIHHLVDGVEYIIKTDANEYAYKSKQPLANSSDVAFEMFTQVKKEESHGKVEDTVKECGVEVDHPEVTVDVPV